MARIIGDALDNELSGGEADDRMEGRSGDDTLDGGAGADVIEGGAGDDDVLLRSDDGAIDSLNGGGGLDQLSFRTDAASAHVEFSLDGQILVDGVVAATATGFERAVFDSSDAFGSDGGYRLVGTQGADSFVTGGGDDWLIGRAGYDVLSAGSGDDTIEAGDGEDYAVLNDLGGDRVELGARDDYFMTRLDDEEDGPRAAILDGGDGRDMAVFWGDAADFDGTFVRIDGEVAAELAGFESIRIDGGRVFGLEGDDTISGDGDALLLGRGGDDVLSAGGLGTRDTLRGGAGDDHVDVNLDSDRDVLDGGAGFDTLEIYHEFDAIVMSGRVDADFVVTSGGRTATRATGFEALIANGRSGNDVLLGGAAADEIELVGLGRDLVRTFGGDDRVDFTLDGKRDVFDLGAGDDFVVLRQSERDAIASRSVVMAHGDDALTITSDGREATRILGAERFDVRTYSGDDRLVGGEANDVLSAWSGRNMLKGLGGDDQLSVLLDASRDRVFGGAGEDALSADYLAGPRAEGMTAELTETGEYRVIIDGRVALEALSIESVAVTGDAHADLISGTDGDDVLRSRGALDEGASDKDTLIGGAGDDTLVGGATVARVVGGASEDTFDLSALFTRQDLEIALDSRGTVRLMVDGLEGPRLTKVENLVGGSGDDRITGDDRGNLIDGGYGDDTLDGGGGGDTLSFASIEEDVEADLTTGLAYTGPDGRDVVRNFESVLGGGGSDVIVGDEADNRLDGGEGYDVVTGGGGADVFVFAEEGFEFAGRVRDFSASEGDLLDVSAMADSLCLTLVLVGEIEFSGDKGEIRFEFDGAQTLLQIDLDGDRRSDQLIVLDGRIDFAATDFILS